MRISNLPPGTTHRPCRICGQPVDVTDDSPEWDEKIPPAHRLCANSMPSSAFEPPLDVKTMATIWRAIERGERFTPRVRANIAYAVESTIKDNATSTRPQFQRRRFYAIRLMTRLIAANEGVQIEREPFKVVNDQPMNFGKQK